MTDYKLMPVAPTQDMLSRVMSIVTGFSGPYGEFNDYLDEETAREVYEAFTIDTPTVQGKHYPDNEWIPTGHAEPDLPDDMLVDVKFANGHIETGCSVDTWKWTQYGESYDITHYRIHQPVSAMQLEPDVSALVEALEEARLTLEVMQGKGSSIGLTLAIIDRALEAYRKQGGELCHRGE